MKYGLLAILGVFFLTYAECCSAGTVDVSCTVRPEKIRYKPGELARFEVDVHNPTAELLAGDVHVLIISELDRVEHESKIPVQVLPKSEKQVKVEWKVPM